MGTVKQSAARPNNQSRVLCLLLAIVLGVTVFGTVSLALAGEEKPTEVAVRLDLQNAYIEKDGQAYEGSQLDVAAGEDMVFSASAYEGFQLKEVAAKDASTGSAIPVEEKDGALQIPGDYVNDNLVVVANATEIPVVEEPAAAPVEEPVAVDPVEEPAASDPADEPAAVDPVDESAAEEVVGEEAPDGTQVPDEEAAVETPDNGDVESPAVNEEADGNQAADVQDPKETIKGLIKGISSALGTPMVANSANLMANPEPKRLPDGTVTGISVKSKDKSGDGKDVWYAWTATQINVGFKLLDPTTVYPGDYFTIEMPDALKLDMGFSIDVNDKNNNNTQIATVTVVEDGDKYYLKFTIHENFDDAYRKRTDIQGSFYAWSSFSEKGKKELVTTEKKLTFMVGTTPITVDTGIKFTPIPYEGDERGVAKWGYMLYDAEGKANRLSWNPRFYLTDLEFSGSNNTFTVTDALYNLGDPKSNADLVGDNNHYYDPSKINMRIYYMKSYNDDNGNEAYYGWNTTDMMQDKLIKGVAGPGETEINGIYYSDPVKDGNGSVLGYKKYRLVLNLAGFNFKSETDKNGPVCYGVWLEYDSVLANGDEGKDYANTVTGSCNQNEDLVAIKHKIARKSGGGGEAISTFVKSSLKVKKLVEGNAATDALKASESFEFTLKGADAASKDYTVIEADGTETTGNKTEADGKFYLKHGQTALFEGFTPGQEYTVTETLPTNTNHSTTSNAVQRNVDGTDGAPTVSQSPLVSDTLTIGTDDEVMVTFTNRYEIETEIWLYKHDNWRESHPVAGAAFTVYKLDDSYARTGETVLITEESGADGMISFKLKNGKYEIDETTVPKGYSTGEKVNFKIEVKDGVVTKHSSSHVSYTASRHTYTNNQVAWLCKNTLSQTICIKKFDASETGTATELAKLRNALAGAKFKVYTFNDQTGAYDIPYYIPWSSDGWTLETKADTNGTRNLEILAGMKYFVQEVGFPAGYEESTPYNFYFETDATTGKIKPESIMLDDDTKAAYGDVIYSEGYEYGKPFSFYAKNEKNNDNEPSIEKDVAQTPDQTDPQHYDIPAWTDTFVWNVSASFGNDTSKWTEAYIEDTFEDVLAITSTAENIKIVDADGNSVTDKGTIAIEGQTVKFTLNEDETDGGFGYLKDQVYTMTVETKLKEGVTMEDLKGYIDADTNTVLIPNQAFLNFKNNGTWGKKESEVPTVTPPETAALEVSKAVEANAGVDASDKEFSFVLTRDDVAVEATHAYTHVAADGTETALATGDGGTFTLLDGEKAVFSGLPVDDGAGNVYAYAIEEVGLEDAEIEGVSLDVLHAVDGADPDFGAKAEEITLKPERTVSVEFINVYTGNPPLGSDDGVLRVSKAVDAPDGLVPADKEYTFVITDSLEAPLAGVTYMISSGGFGTTDENDGSFTLKAGETALFTNLTAGDWYHVYETAGSRTVEGVDLDVATFVAVAGTDVGEALGGRAQASDSGEGPLVAFTNAYSVPGRPSGNPDPDDPGSPTTPKDPAATPTSGSNTGKKSPLTGDPLADALILLCGAAALSGTALLIGASRRKGGKA